MSLSRYFRRRRWDEERAREIEAYLEIETAENIARGMPSEEARHAARRKFGNPTQIREEIYRMNTIGFLETLWQDLRYGARLLRLNPGFTAVALISLALGIGANTAIFQLVNSVRLRTLPVKDPQQLASVEILDRQWGSGNFSGRFSNLTNPLWEQIRDHQQAFSGVFAWGHDEFNLAEGGEVHFAQGIWVSGEFFQVLGVQPLLGRVLTPEDDQRGCASPGAVLSHAFWQRHFGGDPSAVGAKLSLNRHPFEIIGVTRPDFFGVEVGHRFDVAIPLCADPILRSEGPKLDVPHSWWLAAMGRLRHGWTIEQATTHLKTISPAILEATIPPVYTPDRVEKYLEYRLGAVPLGSGFSRLRESLSTPLWILLGITGLVLLIACANIANLMLARASARQREIAVRLALGASRARLIRQLFCESALLAVAGAGAGIFLAGALSRFLVNLVSTPEDPLFVALAMDWRILAFTAGLATLTCVLFGLTPAVRATSTSPGAVMKANSRGQTAGRERFSLRRSLVVSQVALACVLLVGALLFVRSLNNLLTADTGFEQDGILITSIDLSALDLSKERRLTFKRELTERIQAIPGVESAANAAMFPLGGSSWNEDVLIRGESKGDALLNRVATAYFATLEMPLLAGRDFDERDTVSSRPVAIVNELFVEKFLAGADPIGATFQLEPRPGETAPMIEIVGVVGNAKWNNLRDDAEEMAFFPVLQEEAVGNSIQVLLRTATPPEGMLPAVKSTITEVSPAIAMRFRIFKTHIEESLQRERMMALLSGFFGLLATLLATVGLYGVMSYTVARRRNEIGIRMALGADRGNVVAMVLREAGWLVGIGLAAGIAGAVAATRVVSGLLFGLEPNDPATLTVAAAGLAAVAILASYLPARRAANLNPTAALREE
jgi:predicted permease